MLMEVMEGCLISDRGSTAVDEHPQPPSINYIYIYILVSIICKSIVVATGEH